MKVLITGGAGFIGSHLASALMARGASVVVLDNLSTGFLANLAGCSGSGDLEVIEGNVNDLQVIEGAVKGCDWVFHQAAIASVPQSVEQPWETHDDNMNGTLRLLIAARDAKVKRFVFASSSAIYGDHSASLKREDLSPRPLTPYALQKYAGETYGVQFQRLYGLPFVALRYFNVFGPRQAFDSPYSGVIAKFCTRMLGGESPQVFGDGLQSRDFVFIDNVVSANLAVAEAQEGSVAGRFFNVGCGESVTLLDLIRDLNTLTGQALKPDHRESRPGDVRDSRADISLAQKAFGFSPDVTWMEGLRQTLEFYRQSSSL